MKGILAYGEKQESESTVQIPALAAAAVESDIAWVDLTMGVSQLETL